MEIKLTQRLQTNLVMTPQLQQAIRLLQLSRAELIDEVRRELESNPVLADDETDPRERNDVVAPGDYVGRTNDQAMSEHADRAADRDLQARKEDKKVQEVDWDAILENRSLQQPTYASRGGFDELPPIEQSLSKATSLADHLRWQLQMSDLGDDERGFAELVISNLDENGFLDLKGSYRDSVQDLEKELIENPSSKFASFNLGVFHEKMGELAVAKQHFLRFLGDECSADERAAAAQTIKLIRKCQWGLEELIRELFSLPESQPWARELVPRLKIKDATLYDLRDAVSQARRLHKPADGGVMMRRLEEALDGLQQARAPEAPPLRRQLFSRALELSQVAKFNDAVAILERLVGADVEPHERARAQEYIARLDAATEGGAGTTSTDLTVEHLAERAGLDPDDALEVLHIIQNFDPIGVASRDLRECLRVQADAFGYDELERTIIERHLHNLEKHNYQAIARDLKVQLEDVYEACKWIQKLESRPARNFTDTDERSITITPDVYVVKDGDRMVVLDNDRGLQRLYVNEALTKKMLSDPNAKEWVGDKLRNAQWLIRAIEQRRKTIIRVTEAIVERQRDFFEKGVAFLKPMILRDIAEQVEMHESTISRVTTNKYAHTPQGLFELKYFFNSAIRRSDEEDIASESVKQAIKRLIDAEDKQNPLSDQAIVEMLEKKEGIKIARRTVAKYREMMGILASGKRKKLF